MASCSPAPFPMAMEPTPYETLLAFCTEYQGALALLRQHRPYLEFVPSVRRSQDSILPLPLPNVRVRHAPQQGSYGAGYLVTLPCDLALILCDPEWEIKTGVEILVFIHRPQEDFSQILGRWRQAEVWLDGGYTWVLPEPYQHLVNDGSDRAYPLFVVFPTSPGRIRRGLRGAGLPTICFPFPQPAQGISPEPEGLADRQDLADGERPWGEMAWETDDDD